MTHHEFVNLLKRQFSRIMGEALPDADAERLLTFYGSEMCFRVLAALQHESLARVRNKRSLYESELARRLSSALNEGESVPATPNGNTTQSVLAERMEWKRQQNSPSVVKRAMAKVNLAASPTQKTPQGASALLPPAQQHRTRLQGTELREALRRLEEENE